MATVCEPFGAGAHALAPGMVGFSSHQPTPKPMITIDTITTDNCWECEAFCKWWDSVEELRFTEYDFLPILDDGFELSILVDAWANGQHPEPTIKSIADGWDPTPEIMPIGEMF